MPYKPVDTAIKIIIGPLIDDTDFKAREEGIVYNQAGMEIDVIVEKADGTIVTTAVTPTTSGDYDWTHTDQGYYELELPASGGATFNNTEEGILRVVGYCTGVLPFSSVAYDVVPTIVYNSLVKGTDKLEVDVVEVSSDSGAADNLESDYDGTGYAKANSTIGTTTANTDMRGTEGANTTVPDAAGVAATPAEVATALNNYDAPTKAEMDTGHGLLATEAKQDIIDTVADDIKTNMLGVKTWFVDKAGNDGSSGKTWKEAFLTIGAAVSASASGDTIHIGPGTYSEIVTLSKALIFKGSGTATCIITSSNEDGTIWLDDDCELHNIKAINTGAGGGIFLTSKADVLVEDCILQGIYDGVYAPSTTRFVMRRTKVIANWDGILLSSSQDFDFSDCIFFTDGSHVQEARAIVAITASTRGVFRDCQIIATRAIADDQDVLAARVSGRVLFDRCLIMAGITHGDSPADVTGVECDGNTQTVLLSSCKIVTSSAGAGAVKDIVRVGGVVALAGTLYDSGKVTGTINNLTRDALLDDATRFSGADIASIADDVWDEVLTGATHNIATSAGRRLRNIGGFAIVDGTATAGTATTITFDAAAAATARLYNECLVIIVGGLGAGQARMIAQYEASRVATVSRPWAITPDDTSEYQIIGSSGSPMATRGTATGGAASTITLSAPALAIADSYVDCQIYLSGGTGQGQTRLITAYTAGRVATVSPAWTTQPDNTSVYKVIPGGMGCTDHLHTQAKADVRDAVLDDATRFSGANVGAVKAKTDNLPADPASVTNQTTLLNRIGAFTGSGINTILGFLKALLNKATSAPSDVGGTFDPAADSTEAIRDRGDAAWITGGGGAAPTVEEIDAELTSQHGADSWQTSGSVGADSKTITISDGDGNPIDGVTVWITTDIAGSNVVRDGTTNASGEWTFRHDFAVGTVVYVWAQKSGYNFVNPTSKII